MIELAGFNESKYEKAIACHRNKEIYKRVRELPIFRAWGSFNVIGVDKGRTKPPIELVNSNGPLSASKIKW